MIQLKHIFLATALLCSGLLLSACDQKKETSTQEQPQADDQIMRELASEPVKAFDQTPDDRHDIALLTDYDTRFTEMSDEMEDELTKMRDDGTLTADFAKTRKQDNIQSALTMLKELDLKTAQGRYIQGLMYQYWDNQAKIYNQNTTADKGQSSKESVQGLGMFIHAQEQLEHWQDQYPDLKPAPSHTTS